MKTNSATRATCALLDSSMSKQQPATSKLHAMFGNVNSNRPLRPHLSMDHTAGHAKTKLVSPKPHDSRSESVSLKPACEKMVAL
jgi:hypothetical protein